MPTESKQSEFDDDELLAVMNANEPALLANMSNTSTQSCKTEKIRSNLLIQHETKTKEETKLQIVPEEEK